MTRRRAVYLLPFLLLLVLGCGGKKVAEVAGVVSVGGKPLPAGDLVLMAADGRAIIAHIGPNGEFTASQVPVGSVKAAITLVMPSMPKDPRAPPPSGQPGFNPDLYQKGLPPLPKDAAMPPGQEIPPEVKERFKAADELLRGVSPEFKDIQKTPLKYPIVPGGNKITVELSAPR